MFLSHGPWFSSVISQEPWGRMSMGGQAVDSLSHPPYPRQKVTDWATAAPTQPPCRAHNLPMLLFLGKPSPFSQEHFPQGEV